MAKGPPIVADALIGTVAVAHGALLPLVIVDTTNRPDIDHVIEAHKLLAPGDVSTQWGGSLEKKHQVLLVLDFIRPVPTQLSLSFDAINQGGLIDSIVHTNLLYVQGGRPGDRLGNTMDAPRILIEVPSESFIPDWEQIFRAATYDALRVRGLSRPQARRSTSVAIAELRSITSRRIRGQAN